MVRRLLLAMIPLAMLPLGVAVHSAETSGRLLIVATLGFEDQRNPPSPDMLGYYCIVETEDVDFGGEA